MEIFTETFIENFTVDHRLQHRYGALIGDIKLWQSTICDK